MSSTYSSYKFELIGTGEQAGTWGTTTNTNLGTAIEQAIGGYVSVSFTTTTKTLTLSNSNAAQDARALYLNLTGTPGGAATLEVPAIQKAYIIKNATTGGYTVTVKVTGMTGVAIPNGSTMLVYNNGTDVVIAHDNFSAPITINANSSSDALRINQTGAGNALVVEDETNPDATPWAVDASGNVITGYTATVNVITPNGGSTITPKAQQHGTTLFATSSANFMWSTTAAAAPSYIFAKSASGTIGTYTAVASGDTLGFLQWQGTDGSAFVRSADIRTLVDGTVSTGVIPGRMVFRAADSTGTLQTRFVINSVGSVAVGTAANNAVSLSVTKSITGNATAAYSILSDASVAADVTSTAHGFSTQLTTDASVTLTSLFHYRATQSAFGAGTTVTNQYGYSVASSLTGATNNYGFHSNLTSASGVWNFYAAGTANNAFNGNSRFGGVTAPVATVDVTGSVAATTTILSSGATSGIGYATGAGGAVTQTTSRTTSPPAINKVTGSITLVSAAGSTAYQSFTVNNSTVAATDVIIVNQKSGTDKYIILVTAVAAGSFQITFATTGGTTTEQPVFNFAVIKGVAA